MGPAPVLCARVRGDKSEAGRARGRCRAGAARRAVGWQCGVRRGPRPWAWHCGCCSASGWAWKPPRLRLRPGPRFRPQVSDLRAPVPRAAWLHPRALCFDVGCTACRSGTLPQLLANDSAARPLGEPSSVGGLCHPLTTLLRLCSHSVPALLCLSPLSSPSRPSASVVRKGRGRLRLSDLCAGRVAWYFPQQPHLSNPRA